MAASVLIADEDSFGLLTMASALRMHGVTVVGEARTSQILETLFRSLSPDVIIIDISVNGQARIELCERMRKTNPDLGIVITTTCPDVRLLGLTESQFPLGSQVILKKAIVDFSSVCSAIEESIACATGGQDMKWVVSPLSDSKKSHINILRDLTDPQIEIMRLISDGLSNSEIGKVRFVSEKAVEQMIARIAQQLSISHDRRKNLRVRLVGEYYKWIGSSLN